MKFTIEKNNLINVLNGVTDITKSISENDSSRYILRNVKIEIKNNVLTIIGTDADTVIKNKTEIFSGENGDITILGQLIEDVVKKLDDGSEVVLETPEDENILNIKSGKSKFKLMCLNAENFPNFEEQEMKESFKVATDDLVQIIDKTRYAICDDPARYYLNGLFLHSVKEDDGTLKLVGVGTDGHKLAVIKLNYFNGQEELKGIIIPRKTLPEIRKILMLSGDKEVKVFFSKTKIKIETSNSIIISKLIDADFPDYKRVIPGNNDKTLICEKTALTKTVNRISSIVNESHKGIKFILDSKSDLLLEANSAKNGSASEDMPVNFDYDSKIEIAFNSKNLLETLSQIESDKIVFELKDNFSAVIIKGGEEMNNIFVLMPVRI